MQLDTKVIIFSCPFSSASVCKYHFYYEFHIPESINEVNAEQDKPTPVHGNICKEFNVGLETTTTTHSQFWLYHFSLMDLEF